MKKLLCVLAVLLPASVFAADNSVYAWGPWADGIKPAAGPMYVAPTPVSEPQVDTRESLALLREYTSTTPPIPSSLGTDVYVGNTSLPIVNTLPNQPVSTPPGL